MSEMTKLPNIGATLAAKLEAVGITTHEELVEAGSIEAIQRIGDADGSGCLNMLYAVEGAIQGVRWHDLPKPLRDELKRRLSEAREQEVLR